MQPYTPVYATRKITPVKLAGNELSATASPAPTPTIDAIFAGYQGIPGWITTLGVLAVTGAAAWVGIKTGLQSGGKVAKTAGWVGGVGSALLGLSYLGQKSGLTIGTGAPAVNVYPA